MYQGRDLNLERKMALLQPIAICCNEEQITNLVEMVIKHKAHISFVKGKKERKAASATFWQKLERKFNKQFAWFFTNGRKTHLLTKYN